MFKIGDFSQLGQVSTRMLRHYDKLGLLKPSNTDKWTGYRYYTIDQLSRLHRIIALKDLGLSLEQISRLLDNGDDLPVAQLRGMLTIRRADLSQELQEKQAQLERVEARLTHLEHAGQPSPYEIVVKSLPSQAIASIREPVPSAPEMEYYCKVHHEQLYALMQQCGIRPLTPEITLYHNKEYTDVELDVETAVSILPKYINQAIDNDYLILRELPAVEQAACLIYEGPYPGMTAGVLALITYIGTHGFVAAGPLREIHLSGPTYIDGIRQDPAVLELQVPIVQLTNG
ncbi:MAG: MerR family transcriptional regulator [Chloroflexi bacterium]|nr:MAG: MerR family transcriptional regulator [Chloroflexota bacterium]